MSGSLYDFDARVRENRDHTHALILKQLLKAHQHQSRVAAHRIRLRRILSFFKISLFLLLLIVIAVLVYKYTEFLPRIDVKTTSAGSIAPASILPSSSPTSTESKPLINAPTDLVMPIPLKDINRTKAIPFPNTTSNVSNDIPPIDLKFDTHLSN